MIHWLTTAPNPKSPATGFDAGQRGWRLHAVEAPEKAKFADIAKQAAVCGTRPAHGWGIDLFIDERCDRCVRKLGVSTVLETMARQDRQKYRQQRALKRQGGV